MAVDRNGVVIVHIPVNCNMEYGNGLWTRNLWVDNVSFFEYNV